MINLITKKTPNGDEPKSTACPTMGDNLEKRNAFDFKSIAVFFGFRYFFSRFFLSPFTVNIVNS